MKNNAVHYGEKNKRVFRNIVSYLLYDAVIVIFGFILPRLFLVNFGSEVNGLDSTVRQIFSWMSLLEAGVGLASQQALYKPVADNDRNAINSILSATNHYYLKTGFIYLLIMLLFSAIYPMCIKSELSKVVVAGVIIFYGIPGVLSFLVQGKYRTFLEVEGKTYVLTNLTTLCLIVANISRLLLMLYTDNILVIQATYCIPSVIQIIFVVSYIRRKYPWIDFSVAPNLNALKQKKAVMVHQISNVVFRNTDTVMISVLCGFKEASLYAIYMLFFSNFEKLVYAFTGSINFRMGQLFQTKREKFIQYFDSYELIYTMLSFILYTVIAAFILPVIIIYTRGIEDENYVSVLLVVMFTLVSLLSNAKTPGSQVINYNGSFDKTKNHAIIEMVLNLTVSFIATIRLGIVGCLIGTVTALLYRFNVIIFYANKKILKRKCLTTYKRFMVNFLTAAAILHYLGLQSCQPIGYLYVCIQAGLNALWIAAVFIFVNLISEYKKVKNIVRLLKEKRKI